MFRLFFCLKCSSNIIQKILRIMLYPPLHIRAMKQSRFHPMHRKHAAIPQILVHTKPVSGFTTQIFLFPYPVYIQPWMLTLVLTGNRLTEFLLCRQATFKTAVAINPNGIPNSMALITDHLPAVPSVRQHPEFYRSDRPLYYLYDEYCLWFLSDNSCNLPSFNGQIQTYFLH